MAVWDSFPDVHEDSGTLGEAEDIRTLAMETCLALLCQEMVILINPIENFVLVAGAESLVEFTGVELQAQVLKVLAL